MLTQTFPIHMDQTMQRLSSMGELQFPSYPRQALTKVPKVYALPCSRCARRRPLRDRSGCSSLSPDQAPHLVLQHSCNRHSHGSGWVYISDPVKPTGPLLGALVRCPVLFHRCGTGLLQRRNLRHCQRPHQHTRPQIFSNTSEGRSWCFYHMRRRCDSHTNCGRGVGWRSLFEQGQSNHS